MMGLAAGNEFEIEMPHQCMWHIIKTMCRVDRSNVKHSEENVFPSPL